MSHHRAVSLIGAGILIVACGDPYLHTNPYDPVVPVEIDIKAGTTWIVATRGALSDSLLVVAK